MPSWGTGEYEHPWVVQGKGELGSIWANGSGAPFEPQWHSGELMLQGHPRNVQSEGRAILSRGHYGP